MCGICGMILHEGAESLNRSTLEKMCGVMTHRGPDAEGYHLRGEVGMGHRRLSIIDLDTGDQPIYNESGSVAVVFNGEIYNFQDLRRDLEGKGHRFATRTDTEVIPHLYEEYGVDALHHLNGMFALALWDSSKKRLFLARDRLGQKPLFYSIVGKGILFASEIKSILASGMVEEAIDYSAMDSYLTNQFIPPPMTIYEKVRKLPPAHFAVWEKGELEIHRYWELPTEPIEMGEEECAVRLMDLLQEAVKMRLVSDVPLGAFLSGGMDSSLVVALMTRITGTRIKSFSIGFRDPSYDELPYARRVAALFATEAHEKIVDYNVEELLPKLVSHFNEPFGDSSALPVFHLSQMTGEHVKVALSGDGCDEILGGYRRYAAAGLARYAAMLPGVLRDKFINGLLNMLPEGTGYYGNSFTKKLRLFTEYVRNYDENGLASWYITFNRSDKERLYSPDLQVYLDRKPTEDPIEQWTEGRRKSDGLAEIMRADIQFYLPDDILAKVDRMSMAHSLEVRSPFLDHKFQEFAAVIPLDLKIKGGKLKYILKRAAKDLLPEDIINRSKHGFQVPVGRWFREELSDYVRDTLLNSLGGLFLKDYIKELLDQHQVAMRRDHGQKLWTLLILALWLKEQSSISQPF